MYVPSAESIALSTRGFVSANYQSPDADDAREKWSSLIGVVTAICGNILISFALNTQRYAHIRLSRERKRKEDELRTDQNRVRQHHDYGTQLKVAEERARKNAKDKPQEYTLPADGEVDAETQPLIPRLRRERESTSSEETVKPDKESDGEVKEKSYLRSPIWWVGITLMTIGEAGNFLAYGFAPASLVSPLGVVALISNCLIAPLLLQERFRWRDALGVTIAVAGCVVVVLSASDSNPKLTQDAIWRLITQWEFETYFGITAIATIMLAVASNRFGEKTVLIDVGMVALFGGYTALSTKGVASLLSNTIWRVVTFPITYLLVAVLVFTAVMQIKYLNRALQRFNATIVIPTQFVLFTISVIVGSAILYRDFERTTTQDAAEFIGGCALTFLGVWCITSGRQNDSEDDETSSIDEEGIRLTDEEGVQHEIRKRDEHLNQGYPLDAGSSTKTASIRRVHTAGSTPSGFSTPLSGTPPAFIDSPLIKTTHMIPGNVAAIHSTPLSNELVDNGDSPQPQAPPIHTTTSAPLIPTVGSSAPHTPLQRTPSGPMDSAMNTPRLSLPSDSLDPVQAPRLINRQSMVGLIPAPFTSPLSNSLSAIVADSLRRGVEYSTLSPINRRLTRSKSSRGRHEASKSLSNADVVHPKRHSIASGDMPFDETDSEERSLPPVAGGSSKSPGRIRSMSATISDLFGTQKKRRLGSEDSDPDQSR